MCMVSLYLLAILCCHSIDWDIFLRYWCLSQIYYIIIIIIIIIVCNRFYIVNNNNNNNILLKSHPVYKFIVQL